MGNLKRSYEFFREQRIKKLAEIYEKKFSKGYSYYIIAKDKSEKEARENIIWEKYE
jgi:hypothetical protein